LKLQEDLLAENIRWSQEAGDPLVANYYQKQMAAIMAEQKRRDQQNELPPVPDDLNEIFESYYDRGKKERRELNGGQDSFPYYRNDSIRNKKTWAEFAAMELEGGPSTIEAMLPDQGEAVIHGRGKEGKTTLVIHACRAIATGQPFLGRATTPKPV